MKHVSKHHLPRISLSPQFNRPQQGLLYALQTTKRKSKQQAGAKQQSNHFYVMMCTRRGGVPSISVVARSLSRRPKTMRHKTRWNIKNCSGCWAKTTLKSEMDVNHKNEMKNNFRNVHATPLSSVCGQSINPNCSLFPAHSQHCRNLHTFTSASHQMR